MKTSRNAYLLSKLAVPTKLITSMRSVKAKLAFYPALLNSGDGSKLRFIMDAGSQERFYQLELTPSCISLTVNSAVSPSYFMKETILRLLSIVTVLSEDYEIDMRPIVPYLSATLAARNVFLHHEPAKPFNREADIILSTRIIGLMKQNGSMSDDIVRLKSTISSVLAALIVHKYNGNVNPKGIACDLGIDTDTVLDSLKYLKSMGYKIISSRSGNMELVET